MKKLAEILESFLSPDRTCSFGEIVLTRCPESESFLAFHRADREEDRNTLEELKTVPEVREMAKFTGDGSYRPLKTAPTLRRGWLLSASDAGSFLEMIDAIYPGAFATTARYLDGEAEPVSLRETLSRHLGADLAETIPDSDANDIMRRVCAAGCLRKIAWPIDDRCPVSRLRMRGHRIPLICTEACTFAIAEAKKAVSPGK